MDKSEKNVSILVAYAILIFFIYSTRLGGETIYPWLIGALTVLTPLIALAIGFDSLKFFCVTCLQGKVVLFMMLGIALWMFGDVYWLFDETVPSIADASYLLGYLSFAIAFYYAIRLVDPSFSFFKNPLKLAIVGLITALVLYLYFHLTPISWDTSMGIIENFLTSGYILADALLILLLVIIIYLILNSEYQKAWLLFGAAIVLTLIGDVIFTLNFTTYKPGDMTDVYWLFGYICFATGFIILKQGAQKSLAPLLSAQIQTTSPPQTISPVNDNRSIKKVAYKHKIVVNKKKP